MIRFNPILAGGAYMALLPPFFGSYFCKNGHIDLWFFLNSFMVVADLMSDAQFSTWSSWSTNHPKVDACSEHFLKYFLSFWTFLDAFSEHVIKVFCVNYQIKVHNSLLW